MREARDLSRVLDALEERREIACSLGVYGPSYGGAVAHHLAGTDARVRALVTVAAMSDLRERARDAWPLGRWLPRSWIDAEVERATLRAGFRLDEADAARATAASRAPTLLFHGDADDVVPPEESRRMFVALKRLGADVTYTELAKVNHNAWDPAYGRADLIAWMLKQRRR